MQILFDAGPQPGDLLIKVDGDLDLYYSVEFADAMLSKLKSPTRRILIDAKRLSYLDSSGIGVFIRLQHQANQEGVKLALLHLGGTPKKVMVMCNIMNLFHAFDDEAKAWAWLHHSE